LVEETPALDLRSPVMKQALSHHRADGYLRWTVDETGELLLSALFHLGAVQEDGTRQLVLRSEDPWGPRQGVILEEKLAGLYQRWFFRCPEGCGRYATKLYYVPDRESFACQRCAGVQHRSVQRHDARVDRCRKEPRQFLAERTRLRGWYSSLVTLSLVAEAERRGIRWVSPEEIEAWLLEGASGETRAASTI
jgi:hypothetical protein